MIIQATEKTRAYFLLYVRKALNLTHKSPSVTSPLSTAQLWRAPALFGGSSGFGQLTLKP